MMHKYEGYPIIKEKIKTPFLEKVVQMKKEKNGENYEIL